MENNGGEIEDRRLPWGPNGTRRATGASNGVDYGVSDDELCGARVEVLRVVHRSPSGGACTRQVHADNTRGASGGRARAHLLLGSACGPTAVRWALHGHTHTTLPACGRTRLGPVALPGGGGRRRDRHRWVWEPVWSIVLKLCRRFGLIMLIMLFWQN